MRTFSLIVAFAFALCAPSMAGSPDKVPTAGTFAYIGASPAHSPLMVAAIK